MKAGRKTKNQFDYFVTSKRCRINYWKKFNAVKQPVDNLKDNFTLTLMNRINGD